MLLQGDRLIQLPFSRLSLNQKALALLIEAGRPMGASELRSLLGIDHSDKRRCAVLTATLSEMVQLGTIEKIRLPNPRRSGDQVGYFARLEQDSLSA